MRLLVSVLTGAVVAVALFFLMSFLIAAQKGFRPDPTERNVVEFVRVIEDETARTKKRAPPPRPDRLKEPPPIRVQAGAARQASTQAVQLNVTTVDIDMGAGVGDGPFLGVFDPGSHGPDSDIIPMVRINPMYPRRALEQAIEGWVDLEILVAEDGSVADVTVIGANPSGVFDQAAVRAVRRWKFKPRVVDGRPVQQKGIERIIFELLED